MNATEDSEYKSEDSFEALIVASENLKKEKEDFRGAGYVAISRHRI